MTTKRDLKSIIRERQHKTGESYTAARVHVSDDHQGLADDMDVQGQRDGGLDRTMQRPELLVLVADLAEDLAKEAFAVQRLAVRVGRLRHEVSTDLSAPAPSAHMPESLHAV
jgi:hypothetical protein